MTRCPDDPIVGAPGPSAPGLRRFLRNLGWRCAPVLRGLGQGFL